MNRRDLLGALAALPFLSKLAKREPEPPFMGADELLSHWPESEPVADCITPHELDRWEAIRQALRERRLTFPDDMRLYAIQTKDSKTHWLAGPRGKPTLAGHYKGVPIYADERFSNSSKPYQAEP